MANGMVIVTGGGRGIGAATCLKLASAGYAVAVNYSSNEAAARTTVERILKQGGRAQAFVGDVADSVAVKLLFENAVGALGPLTGLVNNAGITGLTARIEEQQSEDLSRLFAINVIGSILFAQEAVPRLT